MADVYKPLRAKRLLEVLIGPCTRDELDEAAIVVQEAIDRERPTLGAVVSGRYQLPPVTTVEIALTKAERQALLKAPARAGWNARPAKALARADEKIRTALCEEAANG